MLWWRLWHTKSAEFAGAYFPLAPGCFRGLGLLAALFLFVLTSLKLRRNAIWELAGLAPLSPADCLQFRARCFRQSSLQILTVLAKATEMYLKDAHSLPAQPTCIVWIVLGIAKDLQIMGVLSEFSSTPSSCVNSLFHFSPPTPSGPSPTFSLSFLPFLVHLWSSFI